jgi:hypothetical protein
MKRKKIAILLIVIGALACLSGAYVVFFHKDSNPLPSGLTKVPRYKHTEGLTRCQALAPECGECYGVVIDKQCYIDKAKLTPQELEVMGF